MPGEPTSRDIQALTKSITDVSNAMKKLDRTVTRLVRLHEREEARMHIVSSVEDEIE